MKNNLFTILLMLLAVSIWIFYPFSAKADVIGNVGGLASFTNAAATSRQICATSTLPVNGTFNSISYIADSAVSTLAGVAIYSDNGASRPGTRLASNTPTADAMPVAKAWATSSISYTGTAGTIYWLCVWGGTTGNTNFYYASNNQFNYVIGDTNTTWETWQSTFVTNSFVSSRQLGIYATYTPTATGGTSPVAKMNVNGQVYINGQVSI